MHSIPLYFVIESNSPAPTPEPSMLKSVGRKHPLSSTGYENNDVGGGTSEVEVEETNSVSDDVLEESLKAGGLTIPIRLHYVKLQYEVQLNNSSR